MKTGESDREPNLDDPNPNHLVAGVRESRSDMIREANFGLREHESFHGATCTRLCISPEPASPRGRSIPASPANEITRKQRLNIPVSAN